MGRYFFFAATFLPSEAPVFLGLGVAVAFTAISRLVLATTAAAAVVFFAVAALRFARVSLRFATVFLLLDFPLRRVALLVVMCLGISRKVGAATHRPTNRAEQWCRYPSSGTRCWRNASSVNKTINLCDDLPFKAPSYPAHTDRNA